MSVTEGDVGNAAIGLTTTASAVAMINEYSTVINIGLTTTGILIGLVFHILDRIHKRKIAAREYALIKEKIRQELLLELKTTKEHTNETESKD